MCSLHLVGPPSSHHYGQSGERQVGKGGRREGEREGEEEGREGEEGGREE